MIEEKEVYCNDCKHYGWFDNSIGIDFCWYNQELDYMRNKVGTPCHVYNRNKECEHYEQKRKWWKFWDKPKKVKTVEPAEPWSRPLLEDKGLPTVDKIPPMPSVKPPRET